MSRAFAKDDGPGEPPVVPARAPLPPGAANPVTPRGLALLRDELAELEADRLRQIADHRDESERTRQLAIVSRRIGDLTDRLASARPIDPRTQPADEVRFGATVRYRVQTGKRAAELRQVQIVGVDEAAAAELSEGRVTTFSPIARALVGRRVGDTVRLRTPRGEQTLEVLSIEYDG